MDRQLEERLQVFEQEGLASTAIVRFVRKTLLWLAQTSQHACTEETAGAFATHLMLALVRVSKQEPLGEAWDPGVHEEAMTLTALLPWAEHVRAEASQELGLQLPAEENDFLLLHLGTFLLHYNDPLIAQVSA